MQNCRIVDLLSNPNKNVSYGTYGKKSIEISPVSWNSNLKTGLPNKNPKKLYFYIFIALGLIQTMGFQDSRNCH